MAAVFAECIGKRRGFVASVPFAPYTRFLRAHSEIFEDVSMPMIIE
jgi:hypothetical protein